jgi:hypothetical protein
MFAGRRPLRAGVGPGDMFAGLIRPPRAGVGPGDMFAGTAGGRRARPSRAVRSPDADCSRAATARARAGNSPLRSRQGNSGDQHLGLPAARSHALARGNSPLHRPAASTTRGLGPRAAVGLGDMFAGLA